MEFVQGLITAVLFLLILGVLVVIHELGHFIVARLANVRVLEFGIGFPPRAKVLRSDGETLYTLNWLPIGGFVKLEGEDGGDLDDPRSFARAPFLTRQIILVAGVVMNLALAFLIFTAIAWIPNRTLALNIGQVQPGSPAEGAGVTPADRIVSIDGVEYDIFDWSLVPTPIQDLRGKAGQTVTLGIMRPDGTVADVVVTLRPPDAAAERGALGVVFEDGRPVSFLDRTFTRGPDEALATGARRTGEAFGLILEGLGQLGSSFVDDSREPPPVTGPIGIARQLGDVFWQAGIVPTLFFAGILSANLALVNILPFPPLDGGRMLMMVVKAVAGARISLRAERLTYVVGFAMLFAFLIWVTYVDITRPLT